MAEVDDSNECDLILCQRCNEFFPALGFDVHEDFCRKFLRLVSQGASPELIEEALVHGTIPPDIQADYLDSDDEQSLEDTLCDICFRLFPKKYLKEHQELCLLEQTDGEAYQAANDNTFQEVPLPNKADKPPAPKRDVEPPRRENLRDFKEEPKFKREANDRPNAQGNERTNEAKAEAPKPSAEEKKNDPRFKEPPHHQQKPPEMSHDEDQSKSNPIFDESRTFKIPYNPLLNHIDQTENEDLDKISDDEDSETLEEFWRRAQDAIKRQKRLNV